MCELRGDGQAPRLLERVVPEAGNVRVMFFTDQQWQRAYTVVGPNYPQGKRAIDPEMPQTD